jgi:hypothetical protein
MFLLASACQRTSDASSLRGLPQRNASVRRRRPAGRAGRPSGRTREPRPPLPWRVTARDNGLGPRRLSLPRAYVRTGDPFRSLPHDPLCPRTMSAPTTARRRRDESFCSVNRPWGHIRASDPRCFVASRALTVRRRCTRDAAASSVATSCEATWGGGLPPSLPRADGLPSTRVTLVEHSVSR